MNKYKRIRINGKTIDEHRLIMEKHLGRKLIKGETVHHIDGDKSNNNIDNLMLFPSQKAHSRFHCEQGDSGLKFGENKKALIEGRLKCSRCGKIKDLSEFWRNKNNYLGYGGICKDCHSTRRKNGAAKG